MGTVKIVALVLAFLAMIGFIAYLSITKASLQSQLAQSQVAVSALTSANQDFKTQVDNLNQNIVQFKEAAKQREKIATEAQNKAKEIYNKLIVSANTLKEKKTTGNDCTSAKQLTNAFFGGK